MKELIAAVQAEEQREYSRAAAKFGPVNNSAHESYAVIREEFEEAQDEAAIFESLLNDFWHSVKRNVPSNQTAALASMRRTAELAAAEWTQVAAMCYKAMQIPEINRKPEQSGESEN